jgi:hypothetical protein
VDLALPVAGKRFLYTDRSFRTFFHLKNEEINAETTELAPMSSHVLATTLDLLLVVFVD